MSSATNNVETDDEPLEEVVVLIMLDDKAEHPYTSALDQFDMEDKVLFAVMILSVASAWLFSGFVWPIAIMVAILIVQFVFMVLATLGNAFRMANLENVHEVVDELDVLYAGLDPTLPKLNVTVADGSEFADPNYVLAAVAALCILTPRIIADTWEVELALVCLVLVVQYLQFQGKGGEKEEFEIDRQGFREWIDLKKSEAKAS